MLGFYWSLYAAKRESQFSLRDSAKPCVVEGNLKKANSEVGISGLGNLVGKAQGFHTAVGTTSNYICLSTGFPEGEGNER